MCSNKKHGILALYRWPSRDTNSMRTRVDDDYTHARTRSLRCTVARNATYVCLRFDSGRSGAMETTGIHSCMPNLKQPTRSIFAFTVSLHRPWLTTHCGMDRSTWCDVTAPCFFYLSPSGRRSESWYIDVARYPCTPSAAMLQPSFTACPYIDVHNYSPSSGPRVLQWHTNSAF